MTASFIGTFVVVKNYLLCTSQVCVRKQLLGMVFNVFVLDHTLRHIYIFSEDEKFVSYYSIYIKAFVLDCNERQITEKYRFNFDYA